MSETYTRINWKDGENGGTPISADNLNLMDLGIEKAHQLIEELKENGVGGQTGKTAYEYAKDGGYTGTEEEFAKKLAQENPTREEFSQLSDTVNDLKNSGTTGTNANVKTILENIMTIMKAQVNKDGTLQAYNQDVSTIFSQTDTLISNLGTTENPEQPESGVVQIGNVLAITSGVTATQTGSVLAIA